ncbi:MAG: hypothetical protein II714_02565, partial [Oscillospiraceae bacterium]|nr:hypothetical protein [Oscillospiraceae bacterium]
VWNSWSPSKTMLRQQLVRMIIHDDALWGGLLADDGKLYNDNKPDEYFTQTRKYYLSADPMSDPHSLWNVLYKPMIDYIDTLPDYFEEGLDALILVPGDNSYQTMLGAWFEVPPEEVRIMKVDKSTGRPLQGAELEVLDADGKSVDSWTSSDEAHTVGGLYRNITYTIREITAPEGYTAAEDITFTLGAGGTVNTEANVTEDGVILVENTPEETPEPEPVQPVTVVHAPIAGVPRQPGGTAPVLVQPVTGEDVSAGAGLEDRGEELPEEETAPSVIVFAVVIAAVVLTGKRASTH